MEHPKTKGDRSTLAIMYGLREMGHSLLVPFGENTRYDLVVDDGSHLWRVQCKTGRVRDEMANSATCDSPLRTKSRVYPRGAETLRQNLAVALMVQDLPLDPLQRVVDRLRVTAELLGHLLVRVALEVQTEGV